MKTPKPKGIDAPEKPLSMLRAPWLLAYRYLGVRVQEILPYFEDLTASLQKAALKISAQSYLSMMLLLSGGSMVVSAGVVGLLAIYSGAQILLAILFSFGAGLLFGVMVFGVLYGLPSLLAMSRRKRMNNELPYVATHMSILASSGIPPTRMFKLLEDSRTTPEVASDSNEIVRDVEVLGNDIMTALELERVRSPSTVFGDMLEGLVATIRSGGDMKSYLQDATHTIMDLKRIASKQLIESLATFAEMYISLLIVFPLLMIVMFSVMSLIGGGLGGLSVTMMMSFITYGVIPICAVAVIVMLDSIVGEE